MSQTGEGSVTVPVVWVGADDLPVQFLNQIVGVVQPNEIFLTLGTMVPPALLGSTPEEREDAARRLAFIPVKPIVRLGLTRQRLEELIRVLQTTLNNYNDMMKQAAGS